jgi:hypothetical protein
MHHRKFSVDMQDYLQAIRQREFFKIDFGGVLREGGGAEQGKRRCQEAGSKGQGGLLSSTL